MIMKNSILLSGSFHQTTEFVNYFIFAALRYFFSTNMYFEGFRKVCLLHKMTLFYFTFMIDKCTLSALKKSGQRYDVWRQDLFITQNDTLLLYIYDRSISVLLVL